MYFSGVYTSRTPELLKAMASDLVWNKPRDKRVVYLTFDDGPTEGITNKVLDTLRIRQAKATFFCVGDMVKKNPKLFKRLIEEGHSVGNHTMKHESGWQTNNKAYFRSFLEFQQLSETSLFRPPYGRISKSQAKCIKKRSDIIMWDVLPGDFDESVSSEKCFQRVKKNTKNGSIIVLHDSDKCGEKMLGFLPEMIDWLKDERYSLEAI